MPKVEVVLLPRGNATGYLQKARQFCVAAARELEDDRFDAALLCAVHAGISAADAVCIAFAGRRSKDAEHLRAADLLEEIAKNSPPVWEKAGQLRALVRQKNRVEYEGKAASGPDAVDAVRRCQRLVEWAESEITRIEPSTT